MFLVFPCRGVSTPALLNCGTTFASLAVLGWWQCQWSSSFFFTTFCGTEKPWDTNIRTTCETCEVNRNCGTCALHQKSCEFGSLVDAGWLHVLLELGCERWIADPCEILHRSPNIQQLLCLLRSPPTPSTVRSRALAGGRLLGMPARSERNSSRMRSLCRSAPWDDTMQRVWKCESLGGNFSRLCGTNAYGQESQTQ